MAGILPVLPDLVIFLAGRLVLSSLDSGLDLRSSCWGVSSGSMAGDFVFCVCFFAPHSIHLVLPPPPHKGFRTFGAGAHGMGWVGSWGCWWARSASGGGRIGPGPVDFLVGLESGMP